MHSIALDRQKKTLGYNMAAVVEHDASLSLSGYLTLRCTVSVLSPCCHKAT